MLEELTHTFLNTTNLDKTVGIFDLFCPKIHNTLMEKRLNNAIQTVELIKSRLAEYGLKVDYQKYFSEKLQLPLEWARTVSEVEEEDQRRLLQNLFTRHLLGRYDDDSHFVAFIAMIKEMASEDIRVLMSINTETEEGFTNYPASIVMHLFRLGLINIYHEITVPRVDKEVPEEIDGGDSFSEPENITWGVMLGEQKAVQVGKPYITDLGREFLQACTEPF